MTEGGGGDPETRRRARARTPTHILSLSHAHTHAHTHSHIQTYNHIHTHAHTHIHTRTLSLTRTHTHTHTHTHTRDPCAADVDTLQNPWLQKKKSNVLLKFYQHYGKVRPDSTTLSPLAFLIESEWNFSRENPQFEYQARVDKNETNKNFFNFLRRIFKNSANRVIVFFNLCLSTLLTFSAQRRVACYESADVGVPSHLLIHFPSWPKTSNLKAPANLGGRSSEHGRWGT